MQKPSTRPLEVGIVMVPDHKPKPKATVSPLAACVTLLLLAAIAGATILGVTWMVTQ